MTQTESIKKVFFSGVFWNSVSQMGAQAIQFITTLVLARLLTPEDFGVVAMATSFTLLAGVINQMGISPSIIHKKNITEDHLSSAFWANIIVGISLCLITITLSGFVADFFDNRLVQPVLSVLSFAFVLGAVKIVNNALIVKDLKYRKLVFVVLSEMLTNGILAITLAFLDFGVWSIVAGRLAGIFMGSIATIYVSAWRPRFHFHYKSFMELFGFGIQAMGVSFLSYFVASLDNILVGRYLGAVSLGVYSIAYNIVTLPQKKISSVVSGVVFAVFSRIQDERERIVLGYIKILDMLSFIIFPMLGGLFAVAPEFILCVLSEKWIGAIIPLRILCFVGILQSTGSTVGSIFFSQGRPDIELKLDILYLIVLFGALMFGIKWELPGVAYALCITGLFMQIIYLYAVSQLIKCRLLQIYIPLIRNFVITLIMIIAVLKFKTLIASLKLDNLSILVFSVGFGIAVYTVTGFVGNKNTFFELLNISGIGSKFKRNESGTL